MKHGVALRVMVLLSAMTAVTQFCSCGSAGSSGGIVPQPFNQYSAVVATDMNGDGKLDIATCYSRVAGPPPHPGTVAIFFQDPANPGRFFPPVTYPVGDDSVSIAVGDLNADGNPDIVTANTRVSALGAGSNSISVLLQDGNHLGRFLPAAAYSSSNVVNAVLIADLNGDGQPDLAVADSSGISILLQSSANPGTFVPGRPIGVTGGVASIAIGDVNGDHLPDLVAANGSDALVFLANPTSPGNFMAPASYPVGQQAIFVALGGLNGDGKPDLIVADEGLPSSGTPSGVHVLLQDAAAPGTFLSPADYGSGPDRACGHPFALRSRQFLLRWPCTGLHHLGHEPAGRG